MGFGGIDTSELRRLQQKLNRITEQETERFIEGCAKELAARLLSAVIQLTPVGDYPSWTGKNGGSLKRGWIAKTESEASSGGQPSPQEIDAHVESLEVKHEGNTFRIEVRNCMSYALT